ncbi:MAG: DUF3857 domain-containing protein [Acidobacteria bacterium]|nr:DUF3857 domain-containing protein [Acidobacteriota bacterium]
MNKRLCIRTFFAVLACTIAVSPAFADDAPGWLKQAASVRLPGYEKDTAAAAVVNEQIVNVSSDRKLVITDNFAVRILNREGRRFARARAFYLSGTGKIRDIKAWIIRPDGSTKYYDKKQIVDVIADSNDVYNEGRVRIIDATGDVDAGFMFGYTVVSEETPLFYQDKWTFQSSIPTVMSRYSLTLPNGWSASSHTFNANEITPRVNGNTYIWEMNDLPAIPDEPMSPSVANLAARIAVNYSPNTPDRIANRVFTSWGDVSVWASALHDPQVIVDDSVAAKARDLTANAATEFEKIRAIGTFVQNLQYISIDIGVGYGNGYAPRSSTSVLRRGYGDCKDKANLMRALLRSIGIVSYPIVIYSGDPTFVRAQWPSPRQFNHCIIAIKVSDATRSDAILEHEKLGRLLIFDATDQFTQVGDIPVHEQGSEALIVAGQDGGLVRMPVLPPDSSLLDRSIEATISADGEMKGTIRERAFGQSSAIFRSEIRSLSSNDFHKAIEGWLTRGATGARLLHLSSQDVPDDSRFDLNVEFAAPRYGQVMQGRLLVFKPVFVGRKRQVSLTDTKRSTPIEIEPIAISERTTFKLPQGFTVDELPEAVKLETQFGKYSTKYEVKGDSLEFTRHLSMQRTSVPVEKYEAVRAFFVAMRDAEQAPVVLIRK